MRRRALSVLAVVIALGVVATLLFVPGATAAPQTRTAKLTGGKEVPGPGDGNGAGAAIIRTYRQKRRVCFTLTWSGIGPVVAAHIHPGAAGQSGDPVVVFFENVELPQNLKGVSGCTKNVNRKLIGRIQRNPKSYYVNIHTTGFPQGAIRGQLRRS
jgi:CHRD domain